MKIYRVQLKAYYLEKMKKFYTNLLQMQLVYEDERSFAVLAGTTRVYFEKDDAQPYYHVCFHLGSAFFDEIYNRLEKEKLLLSNEEGETSMYWKGKQAYFYDPDGNILEILERPFQQGEEESDGWYRVGEIGMPSTNIYELRDFLSPYIENQYKIEQDSFSFFGKEEGVGVLVKIGRNWYPTDRPAEVHPIKLVVSGNTEAYLTHPTLPYEITVRKEWSTLVPAVQFRIARPTNQMEKIIEFYGKGLGLQKVGEFQKHEGYEGVMFGIPDKSYHLEFTQHESGKPIPHPPEDQLLVFYIADTFMWNEMAERLLRMGYRQVPSENPYWDRGGITIEDPDGYRVVLMNTVGI
ncbi:hypothetical protein AN964_24890 [Heyndrickxia shackletonii]|uniref:VOC domain-containing protein n=1 Tax=Heyndrickxia shackletonii TaxID=157838 RepID=A0A0Q3WRR8_9BACI|nr:VOC family protein [Heyndrickxia shackletonii]KQL50851.1 hypothetical protein AN964_24890 [Heyndrickxia shackletonii]NEZ01734.1 VOC family protein [Heyndrickxia shackletonii]